MSSSELSLPLSLSPIGEQRNKAGAVMRGIQQPEERSALLSQAIDLCTRLRDVLERLGPSRFTQSDYPEVSKVHELESTLHDRLRQVDEKRNDALAPVSRLPDDILRFIIQHGHDDQLLEHRLFVLGTGFARLVSGISRRWRAITLDMANVWTYVRFSNPKYLADEDFKPFHPWYGSAKALSPIYASNLERSKYSLLNVDMSIPPLDGARTMVKEYLHVCSNRVAELFLSANTSSMEGLQAVVSCVTETRNTLRRLRLCLVQSMTDMGGRETMEALLRCDLPRLIDVELHSVPLPLAHCPEYLALLRCRRIHLTLNRGSQYTPAHLLALLQCTPKLQYLHLMLYPLPVLDAPDSEAPLPRVLLPELRSIKYISISTSRKTFGRLVAPKLEKLSIDVLSRFHIPEQQEAYVADLLEFLSASSGLDGTPPPVKTLTIKGGILSSLERILLHTPSLEVLQTIFDRQWSVVEEEEYVGFLNKLGAQSLLATGHAEITSVEDVTHPPLCPNLQILESLAWATPNHIQSLTSLAAHRRSCGTPLTQIRMADWPAQWMPHVSAGMTGMPATPLEQYTLERVLAKEVEVLECGKFRWEWKEEGRWRKNQKVGEGDWGLRAMDAEGWHIQ
ncbi:hypothetical protein DACRYDRAFT_115257 [Dacryopinax primogenitus]|uniref:F-box domain-containing protein n=1 Tax=Dacryopinax primogenitus (strain DJM 731) TaxID=1858805 RepID=M5FY18_DACPD|nr:uncharacterized protein DACRYDRAFT_115257 [Dacryopinax primogenitus]EJU02956.1 hypothetical protein DACRYDRAFT_115257 [Dacryopinax primogenitus]